MAENPAPPAMALCNGTRDQEPLPLTSKTPGPLFSPPNGSKLKQARLLFQPAKSAPNRIEEKSTPKGTCTENLSRETPMDTGPSAVAEVPEMQGNSLSLPADEKMDTGQVAEGDGGRSLQDKSEPGALDHGSKPTGNTAKPPKMKLSKAERERAKEEARVKREAEKQRKEQEKRERQEKIRERRERKEREELERKEKREEERKKKEEERKKKEDERNQKLEAKKKKDEEKRQVEEQAREEKLRREQMAKSKFLGFFSKESPPKKVQPGITPTKPPQPAIKDKTEFDTALENQEFSSGYIQECKSKKKLHPNSKSKLKPMSQAALVPDTNEDDDVMIVSSPQPSPAQAARSEKFKLLQFHENHRPAYYGTMSRRSKLISPRNPLKKDEQLLDYEVDSDDEWEEEEPGESISESEGEEESGEDSDEDDGFFVPHGYLSEDEEENSDREAGEEDSHRQKQLAKAKAWEAEFARKCQPLRSVRVGCVWQRMGGEQPSRDELFLQQFAAMALVELPVCIEATPNNKASSNSSSGSTESNRQPVPEEAMPDLIRLVHESPAGLKRLIKTFRMHWGARVMAEQEESKADDPSMTSAQPSEVPKTPKTPQSQPNYESTSGISKRQLEMKITKIAEKESRVTSSKPLWYVHDSVLRQYGMEASTITTLVPLASPFSKLQLGDREKPKMPSPETPCSGNTKKGVKRKVGNTPSVKSLFEASTKSLKINADLPQEKKLKLVSATELSSSSSNSASVSSPHPSQASSHKPHPLPTCPDQRCSAVGSTAQKVIVILTDDSSDGLPANLINKTDNKVTSPATACTSPSAPLPQTTSDICKLPNPLPKQSLLNALHERTNQPSGQGAATVVQMAVQLPEFRIDWKKLIANSNKVVTSADVH